MAFTNKEIRVGQSLINPQQGEIAGELVQIQGEYYYKISNYDGMSPFFMTLVSPGNQWLFIASNGGMTAGRKNAQSSLFPYYTVDKLIDSTERTGAKSLLRIKRNDRWQLWEPFSGRYLGLYKTERNLYKNKLGNKIIFEEINYDLQLRLSYRWQFSKAYGFVLQHQLKNLSDEPVEVELLSGIQNILPSGVNPFLQSTQSTLVDAYRKNELDPETGLGIFSLSSIIVDRAEPSEALRANVVWSRGLVAKNTLLSINQLDAFRVGQAIGSETDLKATKGAYLSHAQFNLSGRATEKWQLIADVDLSVKQVSNLRYDLKHHVDLDDEIEQSLQESDFHLWRLVAGADGCQSAEHPYTTGRHFSNVLYNIMRGGIFESGYTIPLNDFVNYAQSSNRHLFQQHASFFKGLSGTISYQQLLERAQKTENSDLYRICLEYLPLSFSRRHGDPSRPWNLFNIEGPDKHGSHQVNFEGNWRDIFQNWEALAYSFPAYIQGMISKFLNASTIDGYNPYRITKNGIDWEVEEPENPWSFIGYWGDHQIIYLLRLLEHCEKHYPGSLQQLLNKDQFVYANVPYRIKSFDDILQDPKNTIVFDQKLAQNIEKLVSETGSDGKLIHSRQGLLKANLGEKLLLTALTKFYNFIPGGGIWMNTQRPEWNDANNALVGNGVSMVTLYHLRRYINFMRQHFSHSALSVNAGLFSLAKDIEGVCKRFSAEREQGFTDAQRLLMLRQLGMAGDKYRKSAYRFNLGERQEMSPESLQNLLDEMRDFIDSTIRENQRQDGLYHSYNLLDFNSDAARISPLYEMLEGQVAILNADILEPVEVVQLLKALKKSRIYRPDQYSYLLYPDRELPSFLEKNNLPAHFCEQSELVQQLVKNDDSSLVEKDQSGKYHFAGDLRNAKDLKRALQALAENGYERLVEKEGAAILEVYEQVFKHKAFTGRSGTFFAYEGLGSIYWHMVSKLLLAVQESIYQAQTKQADAATMGQLVEHYYEIRAGIGYNKSPELYGAFPTDAYSHTPKNAGARQPGMTGQVKEDIINRWAELGLQVKDGQLHFKPIFWNRDEFLKKPDTLEILNKKGQRQSINLQVGQMAFTYCSTPIVYKRGKQLSLSYTLNGKAHSISGNRLPQALCEALYNRDPALEQISLEIPE